MTPSPDDYAKLAEKLIETFAWAGGPDYAFDRHWRLVGALEAFCAQAGGEEVGNALRAVLERRLKETAPRSFHPDAASAQIALLAKPYKPKK